MHTYPLQFRSMSLRRFLIAVLLLAVALQAPAPIVAAQGAGVLHVDAGAAPGGDGASWATAFDDLQDALARAESGSQVWLAAGVYRLQARPAGSLRDVTFSVSPGVSLYGGFAPAAGLDTWEERDPSAYPAVLSGDLDGDDVDADGDGVVESWRDLVGDNAYHVVTLDGAGGVPLDRETVLDGLVVTGGMADGQGPGRQGGGIYCAGFEGTCSPTLANVVVSGNRAIDGGGIYNDGSGGGESSPFLAHVLIRGNYAAHDGGGMVNSGNLGNSSPVLVDVTFEGNEAAYGGGGLLNYGYQGISNPTLLNVSFYANRAGTWGGGILSAAHYGGTSNVTLANGVFVGNYALWGGGGIHNSAYGSDSSHTIANATFVANHAQAGGGLFSESELATHQLALSNAIFWGNTATDAGSQAFNGGADVVISHSDVEGSGGSAAWDAGLGADGGGNLDEPPGFLREPDPGDGDWATLTDNDYGDLRPGAGSPAADAGDNAALPADAYDLDGDGDTAEPLPVDRDGNPRLVAGSGGSAIVDMGAYEATGVTGSAADLSLEAAVSREPLGAGSRLVYRFSVANLGPSDASQVVLIHDLPPAVVFESATAGCLEAGGEVTCGPAPLPTGTEATYEVTVTLEAGGSPRLVSTASVSAAEPDPNPDNNVVTVSTIIGTTRFLLYLPVLMAAP